MTTTPVEGLRPLVEAAQRVAGVVAARGRGDHAGARTLLCSLSEQELSAGAILVADLSLNLLRNETGEDLEQVVARLCVDIEHAVGHRSPRSGGAPS